MARTEKEGFSEPLDYINLLISISYGGHWSFIFERNTLLNQRPKPHDSNFFADFVAGNWSKSAVFMKTVVFG